LIQPAFQPLDLAFIKLLLHGPIVLLITGITQVKQRHGKWI
jgi:hypothetical protein